MLQQGRKKSRRERKQVLTGPLPVAISNTKALRDQLLKEFKKTDKEIRTTEASLERFHSEDLPGFRRWHYTEFTALNKEKDDLLAKFDRYNEMRRRVEMEIFYTGASVAKAFLKFEPWFEGKPEPESSKRKTDTDSQEGPDFVFGGKDEPNDRDGDGEEKDPWTLDDDADFMEDLAEMFGFPRSGRREQEKPASTQNRLKDVYRQLVRILHPDSNANRSARQAELWHEVQQAYQHKDLRKLEHLLSIAESVNGEVSAKTSCWSLKQMISLNKSTLRDLRANLRDAKAQAAWGFSTMKDKATLRWKVQRELTGIISTVRGELGRLEDLIDKWRRSADKFRKKPRQQAEPQVAPKRKANRKGGAKI